MGHRISRRAVVGGAIALVGTGVVGRAAATECFDLAGDEKLYVGMVGGRQIDGKLHQRWYIINRDDGEPVFSLPHQDGHSLEHLEYGARVWAAFESGQGFRWHRRTRILRVAAPGSLEAMAAREASVAAAEKSGIWMKGVVSYEWEGNVAVSLRDEERRFLRYKHAALYSSSNPKLSAFASMASEKEVKLRIGRIWSGKLVVLEAAPLAEA